MTFQLHDSQINVILLGENTITLNFSQGFWAVDENGKQSEQMKDCQLIFEIECGQVPIENFISARICKNGKSYKISSYDKLARLLKKSPFDIALEYDCDFARSKMLQMYSNALRIGAEIFIEEIKAVRYIHK